MKVTTAQLREKMEESLKVRGLTKEESDIVIPPFVEAQMMGKTTHGITRFLLLEKAIKERIGKPKIIKEKFNYALIDGQKELGQLTSHFAVQTLLKKAKEFDNALVSVINSDYYAMAGTYAREIAANGFIGMVFNNGGPATVTAFGGIDPLFGTNPVAIGIPRTNSDPVVLDMATSERPWGETNLAKLEKRDLEDKTFLDSDGNFTTDPYKVSAIAPFGGFKGSGLNFMFEIMTGAFVSAKMGLSSKNGYDLGFLFIAYSPTMFSTEKDFNTEVEKLIQEVKSSRKAKNTQEIFIPGEKSLRLFKMTKESDEVEIDENSWRELSEFAKGYTPKIQIRLT